MKRLEESKKEELITELTRLLIENDFYEKKKQVDVYIKKSRVYKDLIKMVKEIL